jgi:hypothetical protein
MNCVKGFLCIYWDDRVIFFVPCSTYVLYYIYWPWEVFISLSIMKDSFAGYSNIYWQVFSFRTWNRPFHALLAGQVIYHLSYASSSTPSLLLEFLLRNLLLFWLVCPIHDLVLLPCRFQNNLSLFYILNVLILIWCGEVLFWSCLFGVLKATYTWITITLPRFGKFLLIFLICFLCL